MSLSRFENLASSPPYRNFAACGSKGKKEKDEDKKCEERKNRGGRRKEEGKEKDRYHLSIFSSLCSYPTRKATNSRIMYVPQRTTPTTKRFPVKSCPTLESQDEYGRTVVDDDEDDELLGGEMCPDGPARLAISSRFQGGESWKFTQLKPEAKSR